MANATATINIKALLDSSDVIGKVQQMQKAFQNIKLPDNLRKELDTAAAKLTKAYDEAQRRSVKGVSSKSDATGLTKSITELEKVSTEYDRVIDKIKNSFGEAGLSFKDIIQIDPDIEERLKNVNKEIENIRNSTKNIKGQNLLKGLLTDDGKVKSINDILSTITPGKNSATGKLKARLENDLFGELAQNNGFEKLQSEIESLYSSMPNTQKLQPTKQALSDLLALFKQAAEDPNLAKVNEQLAGKLGEQASLKAEQITRITTAMDGASGASKNLSSNLQKNSGAFQDAAEASADFAREIDSFKSRVQYFFGLNNAIQLVKRSLREAFNTVKELDTAMTATAVVTDFNIGDMWQQLPKYTEAANQLGVTIKGAYDTMTLFYQQGLNTVETFEIGTETMKMARIAGLDYATATDYMTAALRGFNMEINALSAQRVNDVYSKLAAITASDTQEISVAMTKTASLAHNANMEFETTAAYLSQIIETTRESAETAGTALKTVIARFAELKKDPALIGEVDGEVVDANKIETALRTIGVALRDETGQFRNLDDVFLDINERWDSLSTNQQRYIATMAAGSRQQSRFIAMMSNYSRTQELVSAAYNSTGASEKQFQKTQESLETALNRLSNAWNEFTMGIANESGTKVAIDQLTQLIQLLNNLTSNFGGGWKSVLNLGTILGGLVLGKNVFNSAFAGLKGTFSAEGMAAGQTFWGAVEAYNKSRNGKESETFGKGLVSRLFGQKQLEKIGYTTDDTLADASRKVAQAERQEISKQGNLIRAKNNLNDLNKQKQDLTNQLNDPNQYTNQVAIREELAKVTERCAQADKDLKQAEQELSEAQQVTKQSTEDLAKAEEARQNAAKLKQKNQFANTAAGLGMAASMIGSLIANSEKASEKTQQLGKDISFIGTALMSTITIAKMMGPAFAEAAGWIGVAVAAGIAAYKIIDSIVETNKEKLARLEEEASTASEYATDTKKAYDDLLSMRNTHDSLLDELYSLQSGTLEFRNALLKANEAAQELIKSYGLIYGKDYSYGTYGEITFNNGSMAMIQQNQMKTAENARQRATIADLNLKSQELQTDYDYLTYKNQVSQTIDENGKVKLSAKETLEKFDEYKEKNPGASWQEFYNNTNTAYQQIKNWSEIADQYGYDSEEAVLRAISSGEVETKISSSFSNQIASTLSSLLGNNINDAQSIAISSLADQFANDPERYEKIENAAKADYDNLSAAREAYKEITGETIIPDSIKDDLDALNEQITQQREAKALSDILSQETQKVLTSESKRFKNYKKQTGKQLQNLNKENEIEDQINRLYAKSASNMIAALGANTNINYRNIDTGNFSIENMDTITNLSSLLGKEAGTSIITAIMEELNTSTTGASELLSALTDIQISGDTLTDLANIKKYIDSGRASSDSLKQSLADTAAVISESAGGLSGLLSEVYYTSSDAFNSLIAMAKASGSIDASNILEAAEDSEYLSNALELGIVNAGFLADIINEIAASTDGLSIEDFTSNLTKAVNAASKGRSILADAYAFIDNWDEVRSQKDIGDWAADGAKSILDSLNAGRVQDNQTRQYWSKLFGSDGLAEYDQVMADVGEKWSSGQYNADQVSRAIYNQLSTQIKTLQQISKTGNLSALYDFYANSDIAKKAQDLGITFANGTATFDKSITNTQQALNKLIQVVGDEDLANMMLEDLKAYSPDLIFQLQAGDTQEGIQEFVKAIKNGESVTRGELEKFFNMYKESLQEFKDNPEYSFDNFIKDYFGNQGLDKQILNLDLGWAYDEDALDKLNNALDETGTNIQEFLTSNGGISDGLYNIDNIIKSFESLGISENQAKDLAQKYFDSLSNFDWSQIQELYDLNIDPLTITDINDYFNKVQAAKEAAAQELADQKFKNAISEGVLQAFSGADISEQANTNIDAVNNMGKAAQNQIPAEKNLASAVDNVAHSYEKQTQAINENTEATQKNNDVKNGEQKDTKSQDNKKTKEKTTTEIVDVDFGEGVGLIDNIASKAEEAAQHFEKWRKETGEAYANAANLEAILNEISSKARQAADDLMVMGGGMEAMFSGFGLGIKDIEKAFGTSDIQKAIGQFGFENVLNTLAQLRNTGLPIDEAKAMDDAASELVPLLTAADQQLKGMDRGATELATGLAKIIEQCWDIVAGAAAATSAILMLSAAVSGVSGGNTENSLSGEAWWNKGKGSTRDDGGAQYSETVYAGIEQARALQAADAVVNAAIENGAIDAASRVEALGKAYADVTEAVNDGATYAEAYNKTLEQIPDQLTEQAAQDLENSTPQMPQESPVQEITEERTVEITEEIKEDKSVSDIPEAVTQEVDRVIAEDETSEQPEVIEQPVQEVVEEAPPPEAPPIESTIHYKVEHDPYPNPPNITRTITYKVKKVPAAHGKLGSIENNSLPGFASGKESIYASKNWYGTGVHGGRGANRNYEGLAQLGEEGPELMITDNGPMLAGINGPTFGIVHKNDRIFTASETRRVLSNEQMQLLPGFSNGYGLGGIGSGFSSSGGGKKGSGDGKWDLDFDWLYSIMQDIAELERKQTKLQEQREDYLRDETKTYKDLVKLQRQQLENLYKQQDIQAWVLERRKEEMQQYLSDNEEWKDYATYNFNDMTIDANWDKIKAIGDKDTYDKFSDYIDKLEDIEGKIDDAEDALIDIDNNIQDIKDEYKDEYFDFEERIYDALVQLRQDEIDKLSDISDSIEDTNGRIFDAVNKAISQYRQDRENQKTEEDLSEKERRLAYLRQDTSGNNALEIKQLEKELEDSRENYLDQLVDQKLETLTDQEDYAAEQRERQIKLMQEQLDWQEETGQFWQEAARLFLDGFDIETGGLLKDSALSDILKEIDDFTGMSELAQRDWLEQLRQDSTAARAFWETSFTFGAEDVGKYFTVDWVDEFGNIIDTINGQVGREEILDENGNKINGINGEQLYNYFVRGIGQTGEEIESLIDLDNIRWNHLTQRWESDKLNVERIVAEIEEAAQQDTTTKVEEAVKSGSGSGYYNYAIGKDNVKDIIKRSQDALLNYFSSQIQSQMYNNRSKDYENQIKEKKDSLESVERLYNNGYFNNENYKKNTAKITAEINAIQKALDQNNNLKNNQDIYTKTLEAKFNEAIEAMRKAGATEAEIKEAQETVAAAAARANGITYIPNYQIVYVSPNGTKYYADLNTGSHYKSKASGGLISGYIKSLLGEEGPEIVWNKSKGYSYIAGANGPQYGQLNPGDQVFTARETQEILKRPFLNIKNNADAFMSNAAGTGVSNIGDTTVNITIEANIDSDYSVDQMVERVKKDLYSDGKYRNINVINRIR